MLHRFVCVHGVCFHARGFESCWASVLTKDWPEQNQYLFVPVRWNDRDRGISQTADCDKPFPSGWIDVDLRRGRKDAVKYVKRPKRRNKFRERAISKCVKVIEKQAGLDGSLHVIGHSLGSVVAYQALARLSKSAKVKTFFSIGSPLNFDVGIKRLLKHDVGTGVGGKFKRPRAGKWVNIMDMSDFIYLLSEESVFKRFKSRPGDVDKTGDIHRKQKCPGMPPINVRRVSELGRKINKKSVCSHLFYFHSESDTRRIIDAHLE